MNRKDTKIPANEQRLFPNLKSYSVDEILAAGGTTAFAEKLGKNPQNIAKRLENLPKDAFLTDEEVEIALKMLRENK